MEETNTIETDVIDVQDLNFKTIVLKCVFNVVCLAKKELRGGYYSLLTAKDGSSHDIYIEDTREAFDNAVYILALLLRPRFDKPMQKAFDNFNNEITELRKTFLASTSIKEKQILSEGHYSLEEDKVLLEEFKIQKLAANFGLFGELSQFLARISWFELGDGVFDED